MWLFSNWKENRHYDIPFKQNSSTYRSCNPQRFWSFLVNDMQNATPPPPLSSKGDDFLVQKVAQCSEMNEKSIFRFLRFLVFKIWSFKILNIVWFFFHPKRCALCFETDFSLNLTILWFLVYAIWSIMYSTFVVWGQEIFANLIQKH